MDLNTVLAHKQALYRLLGTNTDDGGLVEQGESQDDVAYLFLTRGTRAAQRWMLKMGYGGWRKRSSALSWSGSDATTGGQYAALPTDFLRAAGNQRQSALREANGDPWGSELDTRDESQRGDGFYFRGEQLWLARLAIPPSVLYLEYHYIHPEWSSTLEDDDIDFPLQARALVVAESANLAKEDNWLPGGPDMLSKIEQALRFAREEARDIARQTRQPRTFLKIRRLGNHY